MVMKELGASVRELEAASLAVERICLIGQVILKVGGVHMNELMMMIHVALRRGSQRRDRWHTAFTKLFTRSGIPSEKLPIFGKENINVNETLRL